MITRAVLMCHGGRNLSCMPANRSVSGPTESGAHARLASLA